MPFDHLSVFLHHLQINRLLSGVVSQWELWQELHHLIHVDRSVVYLDVPRQPINCHLQDVVNVTLPPIGRFKFRVVWLQQIMTLNFRGRQTVQLIRRDCAIEFQRGNEEIELIFTEVVRFAAFFWKLWNFGKHLIYKDDVFRLLAVDETQKVLGARGQLLHGVIEDLDPFIAVVNICQLFHQGHDVILIFTFQSILDHLPGCREGRCGHV